MLASGFISPRKKMETYQKNYFKYILGIIICLLIRLIPFRAPNVEPIMAASMPFSKNYGKLFGFGFGFLSILLYDMITGTMGMWTLFTATSYGLLGLLSAIYFKNKENTPLNYAKFAIFGTILYDIVTGLSVGPLYFHQSLTVAIIGQIPFTLMHLVGNVSFALILSPAIYNLVAHPKPFKNLSLIKNFNFKQI